MPKTNPDQVVLHIEDGESPIGAKCAAVWLVYTSCAVACSSGCGAIAGAFFEGSFPEDHYTAGRVAGAVALGTFAIEGTINCCLVPILLTTGKMPTCLDYSNPCSDVIQHAGASAIAGLVGYGLLGGGAMTAASMAAGAAAGGAIAGCLSIASKSCCGLYSSNNE